MQQRSSPPRLPPVPAGKDVSAWRAYNARRWQVEREALPVDERAPFVCECSDATCLRPVELTMLEFDAAHSSANWYAVRPGHVVRAHGGRVVLRRSRFWVVELVAATASAPLAAPPAGGYHGVASDFARVDVPACVRPVVATESLRDGNRAARMEASGTRAAETRLNRLLNLILETAVETLDFDAATVTTRHGRDGFSTVAATDHRMISVDDAQYESREGPCVEVLDSDESIFLPEVAEGADRWADFARTAQHLGVVSTLSLRIPTDVDHVAASLNLYAKRRLDLGEREIHAATSYAEQLAATMHSAEAYRATAKLAADMAEAMRSRAVIEQAKGILMADGGISADEAFDRLRRTSQKVNRKLRDVAQELVTERASRR